MSDTPTYDELQTLVARYEDALRRIDINYRQSSGLPIHLQAYCMCSEAQVALDPSMQAAWCAELAEIQDTYAAQPDSPAAPLPKGGIEG